MKFKFILNNIPQSQQNNYTALGHIESIYALYFHVKEQRMKKADTTKRAQEKRREEIK